MIICTYIHFIYLKGTQKSKKSAKSHKSNLNKKTKDQPYFIQDSDSDLNIREKLRNFPHQNKKFLSESKPNDNPMPDISEISSKSLDSDDNSSSIEETQNFGATSDYKVIQDKQEKNIGKTPRKSYSNEKPKNISKYRNSNVISFGKEHFSLYQHTEKTEKGINQSILEEKEEIEKADEVESNIIKKEKDHLLSEPENFKEKESFDHISNKSKGFRKTLYQTISNFYLTKKFISILRNATIFRRPKWLKSLHFRIINDWTFYNDGWVDDYQDFKEEAINKRPSSACGRINGFFRHLISKRIKDSLFLNWLWQKLVIFKGIVFHPTRLFRAVWDVFHMILIICYLYIIPINLSFGIDMLNYFDDKAPNFVSFFRYFSIIFFILDIFINLNTAFYNKGELIYDRRKIILNYFKNQLFYDILSLIYIFLNILMPNQAYFGYENLLAFLFFLRIGNLNRITTRIEEFILLDETFFNLISLIKLIFGVLVLSHLFACIWHYIGFVNLGDEETWLTANQLASEVWWKKYIYSYYFVVVVMNTVGFGDIVPKNYTERLYSIFFIYFACGMFAYTINSIGIIVQDINKSKKIFKRNLHLINGYMKQKNINFDLRVRIRKYFEYIWNEERVHNEEETQEIIDKLSKSLKDELLFEGNGTILKKLPVFFKNFSQDTLRKLVYSMKEINFTPGDLIYTSFENEENCIFIIRKGEVELFVETPKFLDPSTVIRTVGQGEVFGEISFFSGRERESSARSTTFTSIYLIRQKDFLNIIQGNSEDYQTFCQMKDNANLYQQYKRLFMSCASCKANDHTVLNCPLVHLNLSKQRILQKYNYSQPQSRDSMIRMRKRAPPALMFRGKNEFAALKLMNLLIKDEDEENITDEEEVSDDDLLADSACGEKKELPRLVSDITEEDSLTALAIRECTTSQRKKLSPKFNEKESFTRSFSKKSLKGGSNLFGFESSDMASSIMYPRADQKKLRSPFRKHLTLANEYQRQPSKESLSKYSINSKKSSKSKASYSKAHDVSRNYSKKDISIRSPLLKSPIPTQSQLLKLQESMASIQKFPKNATEDSFIKDLSQFLRKERQKKTLIYTESTTPTNPTKESKQKTSTATMDKPEKKDENFLERMMKTMMTEGETNVLFDNIKSFEFYFPHNNVENVVLTINETFERKFKRRKMNKMNTKKNLEIANLIRNNSPGKRKTIFFNTKKEESEAQFEFDKNKLIKQLKEQEKKTNKDKGFMNRILEYLNIKKKKQGLTNIYTGRRSSIIKNRK